MRVSNVARELETACKNEAFDVVPLFLTVLVAEYAAAERLLKTERSARLSPPVMAQSGRYARVNDRSGDRVSASSF